MTLLERDAEQLVTRQRLLEAAGEVFADEGFRRATVRDICKRAGANVAAVKYHFGGKDQLYAAAIRFAHACATQLPYDLGLPSAPTPRQRLHAFVRSFLAGLLDQGRPAWHGKLMAREMAEPTGVLDQIVEAGVRPRFRALSEIIALLLGDAALPRQTFIATANSVVGQILFYHFAAPVLARLHGPRKYDDAAIDAVAEHITTFCVGGIEAVARSSARAASSPARSEITGNTGGARRNGTALREADKSARANVRQSAGAKTDRGAQTGRGADDGRDGNGAAASAPRRKSSGDAVNARRRRAADGGIGRTGNARARANPKAARP